MRTQQVDDTNEPHPASQATTLSQETKRILNKKNMHTYQSDAFKASTIHLP